LNVVRENALVGGTEHDRSALIVEMPVARDCRLVALRSAAGAAVIGGLILEAEPKLDLIGSSDVFDAVGRAVEAHGQDVLGLVTA
jgi:hypothetical protein